MFYEILEISTYLSSIRDPLFQKNFFLLTLGENKQAIVTLADKLIVTDIDVILRGTWLPVPKYNGTNASQMTHVVYIVKPLGNKIKWKQELKGNT